MRFRTKTARTPTVTIAPTAYTGVPVSHNIKNGGLIIAARVVTRGVVGTACNSISADGSPRLLEKVSISGDIAGGAVNHFVGVRGSDIAKLLIARNLQSPRVVNASLGTGLFEVAVPLPLLRPYFPGWKQFINCLPTWDSGNLSVDVQLAAVASVDVGTGALVFSSLYQYVEYDFIPRSDLPKDTGMNLQSSAWYIQQQVQALQLSIPASGTEVSADKIPTSGKLANLVLDSNASATAKQADTTAVASSAPLDTTDGATLQLLGFDGEILVDTDYIRLRDKNHFDCIDSLPDGLGYFSFDKGVDNLMPLDALAGNGQDFKINATKRYASGAGVRVIVDRILDKNGFLD